MRRKGHWAVYVSLAVILFFAPIATGSDGVRPAPHPSTTNQSVYLVRQVLNTTSDWTIVTWVEGPRFLESRSRILEGAEAPGLAYTVSGLTVSISKLPLDETKVVIEAEALALNDSLKSFIWIEKGNIGATRVQVEVYDQGTDVFTPLADFLHDGQGPMGFSFEISALYASPAAPADVKSAAPGLERKVFAFYYPWYGNPRGPSGQWVHWQGTTTDASGEETIRAATDYPLLGPYDSADERVISAHMAMAKEAGIDGFIVSWWGPDGFEDAKMRPLLAEAERFGLALTIYYETGRQLTQEAMVSELTYAVQSYAASGAFLKDSGRPVLFVFCVPCDPTRSPSFWLAVRRAVEARVGPIVLLGDIIGDPDPGRYLHAFDGFHSYIYLEEDIGPVFSAARKILEIGLSSSMDVDTAIALAYAGDAVPVDRKLVSLSATPGIHFVREPYPLLDRQNGARYAAHWSIAIDQNVSSVLITSWNEWHEGTEIEPSREYGFEYLRLTRQFVETYKKAILPSHPSGISATERGFAIDLNGVGNGTLGISAINEGTLVAVTVQVATVQGAVDPKIAGGFYTYIREERADIASVVVPAVASELDVSIRFQPRSVVPVLEIRAAAYDPLGNAYEIRVRSTTPDIEALLTQIDALETLVDVLRNQTRDLANQLVDFEADIGRLLNDTAAQGARLDTLSGQLVLWQVVAAGALTWSVVASVLLFRKRKM